MTSQHIQLLQYQLYELHKIPIEYSLKDVGDNLPFAAFLGHS